MEFDRDWSRERGRLAGIDEVGRGSLAGPVVVCSLSVLPRLLLDDGDARLPDLGVRDSKQLSPSRREGIAEELERIEGLLFAFGAASNEEIDDLGIVGAANLAASRALEKVGSREPFDLVLADKGLSPTVEGAELKEFTRGESQSFHIAAASILAKVHRDGLMKEYARQYPGYGWSTNVGYGTAEHREKIREAGLTSLHRVSYCK